MPSDVRDVDLTAIERLDWERKRCAKWRETSEAERDRARRFMETLPVSTSVRNILLRYGFGSAEEIAITPDVYLLSCRNLGRCGLADIRRAIPYLHSQQLARVRCPRCGGIGWIVDASEQEAP